MLSHPPLGVFTDLLLLPLLFELCPFSPSVTAGFSYKGLFIDTVNSLTSLAAAHATGNKSLPLLSGLHVLHGNDNITLRRGKECLGER